MSDATKIDIEDAKPWATVFAKTLRTVCDKVSIAGSIRRHESLIGDIEVVCVPKPSVDMFGGVTRSDVQINAFLDEWAKRGTLSHPASGKHCGERNKRFYVRPLGINVDIYVASPDNFGNILAIRTGDAEFSHALVTKRSKGGLMPEGLQQEDGFLWTVPKDKPRILIPCPTEDDFFDALKVMTIMPVQRNAQMVKDLTAGWLASGRGAR